MNGVHPIPIWMRIQTPLLSVLCGLITPVPYGPFCHWVHRAIYRGVYFGASDVAEGSYDRFDFTLSHRVLLQRGHLDLQVNYRRYPDGINAFTEISSFSPNIAQIDGQDRLFFTAALSFF